MTGRYKILEMLYLREKDLTQGQLNLQTTLVATYTLILQFLLKVKHTQAKRSIARTSHALFHHGEFSAFFEAAEQHESIIDRAVNACESLEAYRDREAGRVPTESLEGFQEPFGTHATGTVLRLHTNGAIRAVKRTSLDFVNCIRG